METLRAALPEEQRKYLDPAAPAPARMMASKGMLPLRPREMVIVMAGLTLDADAALAEGARASLKKLPDAVLAPVLASDLPFEALGIIAPLVEGRDVVLTPLCLNPAASDETLAVVAATASENLAEILAGNQQRCLRCDPLVRALSKNAKIRRSSLDMLFDFLVRSGVFYDDMPELGDAIARLTPHELLHAAEQIAVPDELKHLLDQSPLPSAQGGPEVEQPSGPDLDEFVETESAGETQPPPGEAAKDDHMPLLRLIAGLNVAQKVGLAIRGNHEARMLLIHDSNRVVANAAIRSPRVTEQEVIMAAQSRSISDEVVRVICTSKEMTRSYRVKLALVNNPKAPIAVAMRFLTLLRQSDLRTVAKSKNVPAGVANQAKRMVANKTGS